MLLFIDFVLFISLDKNSFVVENNHIIVEKQLRTIHHPADVALSHGAIYTHRVETVLLSPTPSNRMFVALLARFGLASNQLVPQQTKQPLQCETL